MIFSNLRMLKFVQITIILISLLVYFVNAQIPTTSTRSTSSLSSSGTCSYTLNYNVTGSQLGSNIQSDSFDKCCYLCSVNSLCKAWSYNANSKICQLIQNVIDINTSLKRCYGGKLILIILINPPIVNSLSFQHKFIPDSAH